MQYNLNTAFVPLIVAEIETHWPLFTFWVAQILKSNGLLLLKPLFLERGTLQIVNVLMFNKYPVLTNSWNSSQSKTQRTQGGWNECSRIRNERYKKYEYTYLEAPSSIGIQGGGKVSIG